MKIGGLRERLREKLPDYMVPGVYVELDALPLTSSGKIDRKRLPKPAMTFGENKYSEARDATEAIICEIWADVLRLEQVGIYGNFFELGGHSLSATRMIAQLQSILKVELPMRTVFEVPTIAGLSEVIARAKRIESPEITPVDRHREIPLSFAQQRLWFVDQITSGGAQYNIALRVRLAGELNIDVLARSLNEIVRRHEVLRTTFRYSQDHPIQVINQQMQIHLDLQDLSQVIDPERTRRIVSTVQQEQDQGFDLQRGPLLRAKLLKLADQEHVLLLTMHHIVSDGWSMGILTRELAGLYQAYAAGEPSPLTDLRIQYADYSAWQRERLRDDVLQRQLGYWRQQLAGLEPLEIVTDRQRPPVADYRGASEEFTLPSELVSHLRSFSRTEKVTLFMILLAAYQVLLSRYSTQTDIAVGTPIAGRTLKELDTLIGFFVNTLVMRSQVDGSLQVKEMVWQVREMALATYEHQDIPFERLVEELQPERSLSRNPLVQVMFIWQNTPRQTIRLPHLSLEPVNAETKWVKCDLAVVLQESSQQIKGHLQYRADLYDQSTIRRLAHHYKQLLERMVSNADRRLNELSLLSKAERGELLKWSEPATDYLSNKCIHEIFELQAQETPENIALQHGREAVSYRDLNARANRLAHYLRGVGVKPEDRVAICMPRGTNMITAVLGTWKAGAAYVPLDPAYPAERLHYMLEDSKPSILLTESRDWGLLPWASEKVPVFTLTREMDSLQRFPDANLPSAAVGVTPESLAYVIYTSGSTGKPKGVMIMHAGIPNLARMQSERMGIGSSSRVLQFASLSFDASLSEIVMTLSRGATLVLLDEEARVGSALGEVLVSQNITHATFPPVLLSNLQESHAKGIESMIVAGEACSGELAGRWSTGRRLFNGYGPTETTVCATMSEALSGSDTPPIGAPLWNTQAYVLDTRMQLAPIGISGELYIGGKGLARGYLNCSDSTAEKFIPNPFAQNPGERLYRTGDRARWNAQGKLEFLGRIDCQVKIRGHRIELGEVEAALENIEGVTQAAVVAQNDPSGSMQLIAYVACQDETSESILRANLKEHIPDYMLPAAIILMKSLPLTANGKINRTYLAQTRLQREGLPGSYVAPRSHTEQILCGIWQKLLNIDRVGIHDGFFELGGHSLLAAQMISRVRDTLDLELSVGIVFQHNTIAELAIVVEQAHEHAPEPRPQISAVDRTSYRLKANAKTASSI